MDKHSNPRSRQYPFDQPPAKKAKLIVMSPLPFEIYLSILENLPGSDFKSARLVSKQFNGLITRYGRNRNREKYNVTIRGSEQGIIIEHNMKGKINTESERIDSFDFNRWTFVEISSLELKSLQSSSESLAALELFYDFLEYYRQFHIRTISLVNLNLDNNFKSILEKLINLALPTCQEFLLRDSVLPISLSEVQIENSKFEHFRWLDSPSSIPSDKIIKKFTKEMATAEGGINFHVELGSISVGTVLDFTEAWLTMKSAPFFNFTFTNCDELWKQQFLWDCAKRQLSHYCLEFQSKAHPLAHIKMCYSESTNTFRMWPIFDVPAKVNSQTYCSARYFRDF